MNNLEDQYSIIQKIGEGGMGAVFLANDNMLDRKVAIKQLNASSEAVDENIGDRFQQEALALAKLNHPNITHLYSFLLKDSTYWMVMEYVEGKTLEEWLHIHKKIAYNLVASIAVQILNGLGHAHKKGIIHRDIKPANVMINEEGEVKVMDFGIARMKNASRITRHGKSVGTIEYMAPEQIQGKEGDEKTDIYAVAGIMYELLTGVPSFSGDTDYQLMKDKLEKRPEAITAFNPAVPIPLQKVIFKALEINPEKRYRSAAEFKRAIEKAVPDALLEQSELTVLLKASQEIVAPQTGTEILSVNSILARARKMSGGIKTMKIKKTHRPFLLLAASVIFCAILLLWGSTASESSRSNGKTDESSVKYNSNTDPQTAGDVEYTAGNNSFNETPNEMYRRISEGEKAQATPEAPDVQSQKTVKRATREKKEIPEEKKVTRPAKKSVVVDKPVDVPAGRNIKVVLAEDINSEEVERDGTLVSFRSVEDILVDGRIIIRKGAPVKGKIVDVIPSSNRRKRALIGFVLRDVEAVDGSILKLHSERFRLFSEEPGTAVTYKEGQVFTAQLKRGRIE